MTMKKRKKKRTFGDVIRVLVMLAALCIFCYSGFRLFNIYREYKAGSDEYQNLEDFAKLPEGMGGDGGDSQNGSLIEGTTVDGKKEMENPIDFKGLQEINKEVIAWINIEALDISYPVAQGKDNEYYLHNTIKKNYNFAGSIFMDYECKPNFSDKNTLIYGHNMKDGSMFGTLKKFYEDEVYQKSPYFWIYTPEKIYKYEIFSCHEVGAVSNSYQIAFSSDEDFQKYLDEAAQSSVVNSKAVVTSGDRIVTLSTCTGNEATRFIVQGKLIDKFNVKES